MMASPSTLAHAIRRAGRPRAKRHVYRGPTREHHLVARTGRLCAAALGAFDGIVSSPIFGVAASAAVRPDIATAGVAVSVDGAVSMAAGECVSVAPGAGADNRQSRQSERFDKVVSKCAGDCFSE